MTRRQSMPAAASRETGARAASLDAAPPLRRLIEAIEQHAADRADAPAIIETPSDDGPPKVVNSADLFAQARARTLALEREGLIGGTLIAALPSGIDLASWFIAAIAAGVRLVLLHPRGAAAELAAIATQAHAAAILLPAGEAPCLPGLRVIRSTPDTSGVRSDAGAALASSHARGSIVLRSSGTTGLPRLALRESPAIDAVARAVADGMSLTPDDAVLCVPPLFHSYGVDILAGALLAGAALHVMPNFDPASAAAQIGAGVTALPAVPFVYESLARVTPPGGVRLRLALSAGSDLTPRVRDAFTSRWRVPIGQLYGATELGTAAIHNPHPPDPDPRCIGRPLPGVSFRIVAIDDHTRSLPPGGEGQLAVRAPSMLTRYLDADAPLIDGYFLTGDLATLDAAGRATLTGRLKLLIDIGGFKVNPLEVEAALRQHPKVADCAASAMRITDSVRRVRALVVPADPADPPSPGDLRHFLRDRLSPNKIPRTFELVPSLPRSPLGKLRRTEIHED